jgi:hypothetical protein
MIAREADFLCPCPRSKVAVEETLTYVETHPSHIPPLHVLDLLHSKQGYLVAHHFESSKSCLARLSVVNIWKLLTET